MKRPKPTSSYTIDHYDRQHPVYTHQDGNNTDNDGNLKVAWKVFETFIKDGIPVKTMDTFAFRDLESENHCLNKAYSSSREKMHGIFSI